MSRRYNIAGQQTVASPTDTVLGLVSATTIRPSLRRVKFGAIATPADNAIQWLLQRFTAAGTSTGVTPHADDPADPAALASGGQDHTVEPTYTAGAILLNIAQNQRGTQILYYEDDEGPKCPATAANGVGMQPVHASFTGDVIAQFNYQE